MGGGNAKCCGCCGQQHAGSVNIELPPDPVIPLLGIYTKELKAGTQTHICTQHSPQEPKGGNSPSSHRPVNE